MASRKLIVEIVGDSRSLERSLARSTNATRKFSVGMGTILKGAVGFLAVQKGASLAGAAIRTGIDEFSKSARVQAQTAAVIKSTGKAANVTAGQVQNLATSISRLSGIDDEAIATGENLLLTFKNVRNELGRGNAIFDRATRAAVDLSVAGFGSIESTSKQLGKALNDPIRGMTALGRAGVTFTQAQRDTIKALVESNRSLDAQRLILAEVESQVGGSAKALGETLPGKLNILRETFSNVAGEIVRRFEPAIQKGADAVVEWLSQTRNQERIQRAIIQTTRTVTNVVTAFVSVLGTLRDVLTPAVRLVGGLENAVKLLLTTMVAAKVATFATAITGVGNASLVATGKVAGFRAALQRLALISAIAIPITVFLNRKAISEEFNKITDSLPFGRGDEFVISSKTPLAELKKIREGMVLTEGEGSKAVRKLDEMIRKATGARKALAAQPPKVRTSRKAGQDLVSAFSKVPEFLAKQKANIEKVIRDANTEADTKALGRVKRETDKQADVGKDVAKSQKKVIRSLQEIAAARQETARVAREAVQASQFRALGLGPEGDKLVPTVTNLKKQLTSLTSRLVESREITPKLRAQLARIGAVLSGEFGKVTEKTRAAAQQMFDDIRGVFDNEIRKGPLTPGRKFDINKVAQGLGLDNTAMKELASRLSRISPNGNIATPGRSAFGMPITAGAGGETVIHNHIFLDGREIAADTKRQFQKDSGRTSSSTRGRFSGRTSGGV